MSTVQTIYNYLQHRPDMQVNTDDLIHITDQAVRTIAKRLYVLGSDLITGQMEVSIFAEQSYAASLAFVDSNPDTITDAASQFVVESFAADMPITTTHASNPGPFRIATVAAGTLTLASTDSVVAAIASSITVTSDDSYGYLPSDFWGLRDKPYIDGLTYPLLPLPDTDTALAYTSAGVPAYYKIRGTKIYVTPHTSSDYTIIADYFQRPTAITEKTDTIPFNELFDDLIAEYAYKYFRGGTVEREGLLSKMVIEGVDRIAAMYDARPPARFPQALNYDSY